MADSLEARMSVTSIKRVDPYVKTILATATHVALYKFNTSINEWEKTDTEGALFIYSRNGEPYHSIMIMNRLNTDNLIEPIIKNFDYQMQSPFLLYKNSKNRIYGIWFFNGDECVRITHLIESLMENVKKHINLKTNIVEMDENAKENAVDIFSMLTRAREDLNKTPTKTVINDSSAMFSSTPHPDVTSKSVMDFFAKASDKSTPKPMGDGEKFLQRLMSNPVHTVEHIEKQQRSVTPQEHAPSSGALTDRHSVPITFPRHRRDNAGFLPMSLLFQGSNNLHPTPAFGQFLETGGATTTTTNPKPQLMTPMMFTATHDSNEQKNQQTNDENIDLLTEKQLAQTLIYLLKTDENFTKKIHDAYVRSIMEKVDLN